MRGGRSDTSTLYLRFIRSTTTSTWSWPMPDTRSCLVSGSKWWCSVGILFRHPVQRRGDLVLVAARLGLDGEGDGGLRERDARAGSRDCASSQSVSPVSVSLSLATTPISPGPSASTGFCVLPMSQPRWPMRSLTSRVALSTWLSERKVPEYTRKSESLPTCGSEMVLKTSGGERGLRIRRARDGVPSSADRCPRPRPGRPGTGTP